MMAIDMRIEPVDRFVTSIKRLLFSSMFVSVAMVLVPPVEAAPADDPGIMISE